MEQLYTSGYKGSSDKRALITRPVEALGPSFANSERPIRVLVADDQDMMRELLSMSLQRMGYSVRTACNGKEALELFQCTPFDLLLLDVVMPEMTGFEVCTAVRQFSDVPIIMLTALSRPDDIVKGLEYGADNYITKPFSFKEVEAKIQAIVRRTFFPSELTTYSILEEGDLWLNTETQEVRLEGIPVELTPIEFGLLHRLILHPNQPVSKEELLEKVWPEDASNNLNIVELAIRRLRTKIEADVAAPQRVITLRGFGYRLNTFEPSSRGHLSSSQRDGGHFTPSHRSHEPMTGSKMPEIAATFKDDELDDFVVHPYEPAIMSM
ncbi:MAG: response regulator transcription factor [Caldilineaceae bacterium]